MISIDEIVKVYNLIRRNINLNFDEFETLNTSFDNSKLKILKLVNKKINRKFDNILTIYEIKSIVDLIYNNISLEYFLFQKLKIILYKNFQLSIYQYFCEDLEYNDATKLELQNNRISFLNNENIDREEEKELFLENKDDFLIENKLNRYNYLQNSAKIPNIILENEYYLFFDFCSGGVIAKPNKDGYIKAYIQTNFVQFKYIFITVDGINKHLVINEKLEIEIEVHGYPNFHLFYDEIGFRKI